MDYPSSISFSSENHYSKKEQTMKKYLWVILLLTPFLLTACLDDEDDDDNPDADSGWTAQSTGISNTDYRMIPTDPTPTVSQITDRTTYTCTAIAAIGSNVDDSKMVSLHFDSDGVAGTLQVTTFIGNTTCASGGATAMPTAGDYADIVYFDHVLSSKGDYVFNRFDVTVTGFSKKSLTQDGADALNAADSNAGSCGDANWTATTELSIADTSICTGGLDKIHGFMLKDAATQLGGNTMTLVEGTVLEGVQTWAGDILTLALAAQGNRPTNVTTTRLQDGPDNWYDFIDGAPAFSRY